MKMGKVEKSLILDSYIRRRKSNQNTDICEKQKKRDALRRLSIILRKCETLRTPEEICLLESGEDIVKQILRRQDRVKRTKERVLEKEDPFETIDKKAQELANVLSRAKHLVCYTGAGISTSARIPDYRGSQGIWTLLQKGQDIGQHDLSLADPTFTHMALYELHRRNILRYVLSQNCDGLHLRSGLPRKSLSEVHGNMYIEVCKNCKPNVEYWRLFDTTEQTARYYHKTNRRCHFCGKPLVDTIVHFGERGSLKWPLNWDGACKHAEKADVILCLGSSLKVLKKYTWLWAMDRSRNKRPKIYIVNLQWTPKDGVADMKIHGKCDEVMRLVMKYMDINVPKYTRISDPIFAHANLLATEEMHTVSQPMLKAHKEDNQHDNDVDDKDQLPADMEFKVKKIKREIPDLIPIEKIEKSLDRQSTSLPIKIELKKEDEIPPNSCQMNNDSNMATTHTNTVDENQSAPLINETGNIIEKLPLNHKSNITSPLAKLETSNSITSLQNTNEKNSILESSQLLNTTSNGNKMSLPESTDSLRDNSINENCLIEKDFQSAKVIDTIGNGCVSDGDVYCSQKMGLLNGNCFLKHNVVAPEPVCDSRNIKMHLPPTSQSPLKEDNSRHPINYRHRIACVKSLTTNRTTFDSANDDISSIKSSAIPLNDKPVHEEIRIFTDKEEYTSLLNYCKAIKKSLPHWYDVNYAYSGLHSIIHPPPNEVDIWGTIIIPIFQLNRKEAECDFCFDHYAEYVCQFYWHRQPEFQYKKQRNGKVIVCECCDYTDESDNEQQQQLKLDNQNEWTVDQVNDSDAKCAKLNVVVRDTVKVQAGWYGKGYRKMIRRKRRTKLGPLVTI